jgi:hypothetical protein
MTGHYRFRSDGQCLHRSTAKTAEGMGRCAWCDGLTRYSYVTEMPHETCAMVRLVVRDRIAACNLDHYDHTVRVGDARCDCGHYASAHEGEDGLCENGCDLRGCDI